MFTLLKYLKNMRKILPFFIFTILVFPLFCSNFVTSTPREITITVIDEKPVYELEHTISDTSNELQSYENFGDQKDFWTANLQTNEWFQVRATLLAVGDNCYIYMDNRTIVSMGQSQAIERSEICRNEFDRIVYPKNFELMGSPDGTLGDIDDDPRITVFLVQGVGSYYLQHNELVGTSYSNNREMVYVATGMQLVNTIAVMCHETNHLFLFNYDLDEAIFFVEGLAEFSMYNAGYMSNNSFMQGGMTLNTTMSSYLFSLHPSVSLFFFDENYFSYASYGAGYMFLFYLAEKYGIQIIRDLVPLDSLDGSQAIEQVLSNHGYNMSFNEIFLDFITACTIDETGIYGNLYGFSDADFQTATRQLVYEFPYSVSDIKHRYYGVEIKEIHAVPNEFTLEIETPESPRSLGVVTIIHDDNGWNITQLILTGDGSTAQLLCEGDNIAEVYVVTSMIREGTPNAPKTWMESPSNLLDFTIKEGHSPSTTDETRMTFLSLLPFLLVAVILTRKIKA